MSQYADLSWQNANLRLEVHDLKAQLAAYKSGEMLCRIREAHRKDLADKDREIRKLKSELEAAHAALTKMRNCWMEVYDDVKKEADR